MITNNYIKKDITKEWLSTNGFRYSRLFSDLDSDAYTYRFPVYKHKTYPTLECEIIIFIKTGKITINVYENGTRDRYAPFYYQEYGSKNKILNLIDKKIKSEFEKLGIIEE